MDKYEAITKILKGDENLSLELYFHDSNNGVKNIRNATIFEPDPNEGKLSPDQTHRLGPRRAKRHKFSSEGGAIRLDYKAKDADEAVALLEESLAGECDVKNTIREPWIKGGIVHGYEQAEGGLDNWLMANLRIEVYKDGEDLTAVAKTQNFAVKNIVITERKVMSVTDALDPYQEQSIPVEVLQHIQKGAMLRYQILKHGGFWEGHGEEKVWGASMVDDDPENVFNFDSGMMNDYFVDREALVPFNLTSEAKDSLLLSMAVERLFKKP